MTVLANCTHCRHEFEVESRLQGALVPCPRCQKVVDVPGTRDPLWTALRLAVVAAAIVIGWLVGAAHGGTYGVATGVGALALAWLLGRAL